MLISSIIFSKYLKPLFVKVPIHLCCAVEKKLKIQNLFITFLLTSELARFSSKLKSVSFSSGMATLDSAEVEFLAVIRRLALDFRRLFAWTIVVEGLWAAPFWWLSKTSDWLKREFLKFLPGCRGRCTGSWGTQILNGTKKSSKKCQLVGII